jgi:N-acetylmuramic acid 6-phosphate etherase
VDDPGGAREELDRLGLTERDMVLGIATGGTTPYVLGALRIAKESSSPPLTGLLVCTPMDRPAWVDHLIVLGTGPEVLTGSTRMKAGTATKLALNIVSTTLMIRSGRVYENLMVDLRATNAKLRDRAARIIGTLTGLSRDACLDLLDRAGNAVKTAVVMYRRGVDQAEAERLLAACSGRLDAALQASRQGGAEF